MATSVESLKSDNSPKGRKGGSLSRQPKYFEADGALRAYANRSFLIAVFAAVIAMAAVIGFLFVRFQPPTVIRVLPSGEASVVGSNGSFRSTISPSTIQGVAVSQAPSQYEKDAYVRTFLDNYLNYDEHTLGTNWSHALNMMTANLRQAALAIFQKNDTVGKYEQEHVRSVFKLTHLEASQTDPLLYTAYGVRTVHRLSADQTESVDEIVESYQVRLSESDRSALDPTGLLIAQVVENQIHAESKTVDSVNTDSEGGNDK